MTLQLKLNTRKINTDNLSIEEIQEKAQEEGKVASLGMPDSWANWIET